MSSSRLCRNRRRPAHPDTNTMLSCNRRPPGPRKPPRRGLMPRYQEGSIRQIRRADGMTWVLRYYTTRADGKGVEHIVAIGLVKDIGPKKSDASREADRRSCAKPSTKYNRS